MSTIGTVRVIDSLLTSGELADHLASLRPDFAGREPVISDQAAVTIAAAYGSPGTIGDVLAAFATGVRVDANDLHDDIVATRRHHLAVLGDLAPASDIVELDRLAAWVAPKRTGVRVIVDTYRVVDDGHGGSVDDDHDTRETFVPCRAETGDGWRETVARVAADTIRAEWLTFDDAADWATGEPYQHPHDDTVIVTTAHLHNLRDRDERRVVRMVNYGR